METMKKLCKLLEKHLEKMTDYFEQQGKIEAVDLDYLDKLTHSIKSIKTTMAMEGYGEEGRSERRGRDSMGRYTSGDSGEGGMSERWYLRSWDDGSSYGADVKRHLREMIDRTSDERVRRALETALRECA